MTALRQGLERARGARMPQTEFRTSFTQPQGLGRTDVIMGRVVNVNLVNHTVDVCSQFEQMRIFDIPISSPYLHSNRGDGFTQMPEVGAKCSVCWPGDSSPPFVLGFVMVHEAIPMSGNEEAPAGTADRGSNNQAPTSASFAGGRPAGKPGDMYLRGRDGNFIVLHRGGVLQIGSNELAQRVYIPLSNLVLDFAENYALHNSGGSICWGIQNGEGEDNLPAEHKHTFRVYANDQYADVRIATGRVHDPVPEADSDAITDQGVTEVGKDSPIVYEMTLARGGFKAEDGSLLPATKNLVKLRFFFDRVGNSFLRMDGNLGVLCRKRLRLRVKDDMEIFADSNFSLTAKKGARISAATSLEISSSSIRINGGDKPVARVGDSVLITLPASLLAAAPTPTGFAPAATVPGAQTAVGTITSGRPDFLA